MKHLLLTAVGEHVSCQRMGKRVPQADKDSFAETLKAWRKREGFSQAEAARVLLVPSVRTLQNWEIARTKPQGLAAALILRIITPKRGQRHSV